MRKSAFRFDPLVLSLKFFDHFDKTVPCMGEKYFNMLTLCVLLLCYSKKISSADHSTLKFQLQFEIKDFSLLQIY